MTACHVRTQTFALADDREGGEVVHLVLDCPAKRNALSAELCEQLRAQLLAAAAAGARAAVLSGEGEVFCSGFDVDTFPREDDPDWPAWLRDHGPLGVTMRAVSEGPLPVVAALNGPAIGAGCELALACDLRVGHAGAWLQMPPVRLGLIYTPEGVMRLVAACGLSRARQVLLTSEPVAADEAERWGLVHRLVPRDEVFAAALRLARTLAAQPELALRGTRLLLSHLQREGPQLGADAAEQIHALRQQAFQSADARAARAAFAARPRRG
jgi:enoyl-CoA hydratase/carnithine racemase